MRFFATVLVLLGAAAISEAAGCGSRQCQCLFKDGSHCCVFGANAQTPDTSDCTAVCRGASRLLQSGENKPAKCNAGGKFSCVSIFTAQGRTPCYNL
ncbi:hypothetical protein T440DRAFT_506015 [Plenodomus tracheiphilus IPT5]|uniref:Extracellular membrane protein CFEM domain-containing protein n=1 Tax=Plenodomus tracheiphilus IPT5 TaxID=1408161 RepID=A0A6A7BG50_9PLEO|nr:hypothetical protein T440DRAFT_506015 [Plenodomus tracheiphilus IPT5]